MVWASATRLTHRRLAGYPLLTLNAVLLVLCTSRVQGQAGECETCLSLSPVAALSTAQVPVVPSMAQSVLQTTDGRLLVSYLFTGVPQFAVYDSVGDLVDLVGRVGEGPGEFRRAPRLYSGPRGTVWAVDADRLVRWDPLLRPTQTSRLPERVFGDRSVVLPSGSVVLNMSGAGPAGPSFSVAIVDSTGATLFKLSDWAGQPEPPVIAPADGDGFWVVGPHQSLLHRYSSTGRLLEDVRVDLGQIDAFADWPAVPTGAQPGGTPPPAHVGMLDIGDGLLVLLTAVPDIDGAPTPTGNLIQPEAIDGNEIFDTVLTLVDLSGGRVIGIRRLPESLHVVGTASAYDLVYAIHAGVQGHVITEVMRISGQRPGLE